MTIFQRWDASLKIPGFFLLMMAMAFIRNQKVLFVLPFLAAALFACSGAPLKLLLSRLKAPILILLFVSVFLVLFYEGSTFFSVGPVQLKLEGAIKASNTAVRVLSIVTVGFVMVHT
ncbi:MAG: hypothetical protein GY852_07895, partial [bacterium]|nr:hypothetical protein [bacterium]